MLGLGGGGGGRLVARPGSRSIVLAPAPVSSACWRRSRLASCAFCSFSSWWSRCRSRRVRCAEISACISVVTDCLLIRTVAVLGGSDWLVIYSLCAIGQLTGPGRDPCRSRRSGPDLLLLCMLRTIAVLGGSGYTLSRGYNNEQWYAAERHWERIFKQPITRWTFAVLGGSTNVKLLSELKRREKL
jgi:hypothetical protein